MKKVFILSLILLAIIPVSFSQIYYTVPYSDEVTIVTDSGVVTDHAEDGPYANGANGNLIIRPDTLGKYIQLSFTEFDVEGVNDYLSIYSGDTAKPSLLIQQFSSNPGTVTSAHFTGSITLKFYSNATYAANGFKANITSIWRTDPTDITCTITVSNMINGIAHASPGSILNVVSNLRNQTNYTAMPSTSGYYLSLDSIFDVSDVRLDSVSVPVFQGKSSYIHTAGLTIPAQTAPGQYYLLYVADISNTVNETNEQNNTVYAKVDIYPSLPDFSMTQVTPYQKGKTLGDTLAVASTISNHGFAPSPSSLLGHYLSTDTVWDAGDVLIGANTINPMQVGQTATINGVVTIPSNTAYGFYYIVTKADYSDAVAEHEEQNNFKYVIVQVVPVGYDIEATYVPGAVPLASVGTTAVHAINTKILGSYTFPTPQLAQYISADSVFDPGDILIGTGTALTSAQMGSGISYTTNYGFIIPNGTPNGNYYIIYFFDSDNAVAELNENNNIVIAPVKVVTAQPDLSFIAYSLSIDSVWPNVSLTAHTTVKNTGTANALSANVAYYLSDDTIFGVNDILLDSVGGYSIVYGTFVQRIKNVKIPTGTPAGTKYIVAVADYENVTNEINEADNITFKPIRIMGGTPDLAVNSASYTASILAGTYNTATFMMHNYGNGMYAPGTNAATRQIFLSTDTILDAFDVRLDSVALTGTIAPNISYAVSRSTFIPVNTPPGAYYIIVVVDKEGNTQELSESNNQTYTSFTIMPNTVDLSPTIVYCPPTPVPAGQTIGVNYRIFNYGNTNSATAYTGIFLSTDTFLDAADIRLDSVYMASCQANSYRDASRTVMVPSNILSGQYYVLYKADYKNTMVETDENNNLLYRPLTVFAPTYDLEAVGPITLLPDTANNGATASLQVQIRNNFDYTPAKVYILLSQDTIEDPADTALYIYNITSDQFYQGPTFGYLNASITIPANWPQGHQYILAHIDRLNELNEVNEYNNTVYEPIFIRSNVQDVALSNLTMGTHVLYYNDTTTISVTASNLGTVALNNVRISFHIADDTVVSNPTVMDYLTTVSLAEGESKVVSFVYTMPYNNQYGNFNMIALADGLNAIAESNENNNIAYTYINWPDTFYRDLTLQNLIAVDTLYMGDTVPFSYHLLNIGNEAADHVKVTGKLQSSCAPYTSLINAFYNRTFDAASHSDSMISALAIVPYSMTAGNYNMVLFADYEDANIESNESNNILCKAIYLRTPRRSDIYIANTSLLQTVFANSNDSIRFTYILGNAGNRSAPYPIVSISLSDDSTFSVNVQSLGSTSFNPMMPGDSITVQGSSALPLLPSGTYYIRFSTSGGTEESSYSNNDVIIAIYIGQLSGIDDVSVKVLKLWPNPASDKLKLYTYTQNTADATYTVYNIKGGICLQGYHTLTQGYTTLEIPTSTLPEGMYTLVDGTGQCYRFIISR